MRKATALAHRPLSVLVVLALLAGCTSSGVQEIETCRSCGRTVPVLRSDPPDERAVERVRAVELIDAVPMRPIGDNKNFRLEEEMRYTVKYSNEKIWIPRGFVTDFASVPGAAQSFVQVLDKHLRPSIVHDYLYWTHACARNQADSLFYIAMLEHHVDSVTAEAMWLAVRLKGKLAWDQNAEDRRVGYSRVVPLSFRNPRSAENWNEYREALRAVKLGIPEPPVAIMVGFCDQGGVARP